MSSQESGLEEPCKEWFSFSYRSHGSKSKLFEMKQDDYFKNRKPTTFTIDESLNWNQVHGWALLEMFFHFHEKGIIWEELIMHTDKYIERFARPLLHAVNTMNVFKKMSVTIEFDDDSEEYSDLCPGITSNNFTEIKLYIEGKPSRGHCLALNNLLQANTPCFQKLWFKVKGIDYGWILQSLRNNTTLKELVFFFPEIVSEVTDEITSSIVEAVARNPNLERLKMWFQSHNGVGDLSSEAFMRLLSHSTSLKTLTLGSLFNNEGLNAEYIIQGLKNSPSLVRLGIFKVLYGDLIFTRIFRILPDCPFLEHIHLYNGDNALISEEDLDQVKILPRLPRPIRFMVLESEKFSDSQLERLSELLRYHPEMILNLHTCVSSDYSSKTEFWHIVYLNWHGRYLLDRPNVPLSIWPRVLEKVNGSKIVKDKASIIYDFLKGPAWGGRTSLKKRVD